MICCCCPPQEEAELLRKLNKERKDVAPQGAQGATGEGLGDCKANGAAPAAAAPAPPAGSDEAAMAARLVAVYQRLQEIDAYGVCGRGHGAARQGSFLGAEGTSGLCGPCTAPHSALSRDMKI